MNLMADDVQERRAVADDARTDTPIQERGHCSHSTESVLEERASESVRGETDASQLSSVPEAVRTISLQSPNPSNTAELEATTKTWNALDGELGFDGAGEAIENVHERCEHKIHELWQTVKTLKTYVESFRIEIEDLRIQRDDAIESAERAWEENAKLAGNNNPQQKIKYVEIVKKENAELVQKVRKLQSQLTRQQLKGSDAHPGELTRRGSEESEALEEYPPSRDDEPVDDAADEERKTLLNKMWAWNKKLEQDIDRFKRERQALVDRIAKNEPLAVSTPIDRRPRAQSFVNNTAAAL